MRRPLFPTQVHAALDVALSTFLIVMPWVFEFPDVQRARGVAVAAGAAGLAMSALTRYELGLVPVIPMAVHLAVDALFGLFLLTVALGAGTSGASTEIWVSFLVVGLLALGAAFLTRPEAPVPSFRRTLAASGT